MQNLLFFCRVSFICNICFLLALMMRYYPVLKDGQASSTIIVLGVAVATVLNIIVSSIVIAMLARKKSSWHSFPRWLIIVNFLFLTFQLILFFK